MPDKKYVWQVMVCDYEACWSIGTYDSEEKAHLKMDGYVLDKSNFEQNKQIVKVEVL